MTQRMNILFIHQNFPGQFKNLAISMAKDGHQVVALSRKQAEVEGVTVIPYGLNRDPEEKLPYLMQELDPKLLRGESAGLIMEDLRQKGFTPDIVYAHPGWGEAMFVKTIWPETRLVVYAEWYYNPVGQEVDFDAQFSPFTTRQKMRLKVKNTAMLHALSDADDAISPTKWQKSRYPRWAWHKIRVIHDGLDLDGLRKDGPAPISLPKANLTLEKGDPVITFSARYLEPVRGFHRFMSALPDILKQRPDAQVLIMGLDAGIPGKKGYGQDNPEGVCWRESLLKKYAHQLDTTRVHFLGFRSYATYEALLKISACHVYLTYPFVLSWSFLEAAALGIPTVASDVAPVQEFSHLNNLRFVDFHDTSALSRAIVETLNQPPVCMPNDLSEYDVKSVIPRIKKVLIDPLWLARKNAKHKSSAEIQDSEMVQSARKPAHNEPIRLITSKNQPEQPAQIEETPVISKDKAQPDVRAKGKRRTPRRRYTPMVRNKKR